MGGSQTVSCTVSSRIQDSLNQWRGMRRYGRVRRQVQKTLADRNNLRGTVDGKKTCAGNSIDLRSIDSEDASTLSYLLGRPGRYLPYRSYEIYQGVGGRPPQSFDDFAMILALSSPLSGEIQRVFDTEQSKDSDAGDRDGLFESYFETSNGIPLWHEDFLLILMNVGGFDIDEAWSVVECMVRGNCRRLNSCARRFVEFADEMGVSEEVAAAGFDRLLVYARTATCKAIVLAEASVIYSSIWIEARYRCIGL